MMSLSANGEHKNRLIVVILEATVTGKENLWQD